MIFVVVLFLCSVCFDVVVLYAVFMLLARWCVGLEPFMVQIITIISKINIPSGFICNS